MALSNELISEFVKVTKDDTKKKSETIVYGTVVKSEGTNYVKMDGSELLTPVTSTTNLEDKERVTVMIKNHTAVVTGNISSPAARTAEVETVSTDVKKVNEEVTKMKTLVADKVSTALLEAQVARIDDLEAKDVTITGKLDAAEANITKLEAQDATITGELDAAKAKITYLESDEAVIDHINALTAKINEITTKQLTADALYSALANINVLIAGTAEFDKATVQHLVANVFNLTGSGVAEDVFIHNLVVSYAQMVSAAIGDLCIKASDGNYYAIDVGQNGQVVATKTTVTDGEISAGVTSSGSVILETNIAAENLSAGSLKATYALVNQIDAARIDVDQLFAREAFISKITTGLIIGDKTLTQIGGEATDAIARVDNLFGNRNFLIKTAKSYTAYGGGESSVTYWPPYVCPSVTLAKSLYGRTVTISFDYVSNVTSGQATFSTNNVWQVIRRFSPSDTSGHAEVTLNLKVPNVIDCKTVYFTGIFGGSVTISNLKIELGTTATAWTPAPEDYQYGGINLARNTSDSVTTLSNSANGSTRTFTVAYPYWRGFKIRLDESEKYTLSFDYEFDWTSCSTAMPTTLSGLSINLFNGDGVVGSANEFKTNIISKDADYMVYGDGYSKGKFVITFNGVTDPNYPYFAFRALRSYGPDITNLRITISNFMLEKGIFPSKWGPSPEDVQEQIGDVREQLGNVQADADFATPHDSEEPPVTAPAAGKLWIDRGTTPPIFRRWKGKDVSTDREWDHAFALGTGTNPNAYYDNSTELLERIDSVMTVFTPGQSGSGNPTPSNYRPLEGYTYMNCLQNSYGQTSKTFSKGELGFGKLVYGAEIDWLSGTWKQTHWEFVLTGTEAVSLVTVNGYPRFTVRMPEDQVRAAATFVPVCTHLLGSNVPYGANNVNNTVCIDKNATGYSFLYIRCDAYATVDDLKAWLAAQYAAGTPVRVVFELKEPISHSFSPANIEVFDSYLYINVGGYVNGTYSTAAPKTLSVTGTLSGWETMNSADDIRAAQTQIQEQQQNAQAAIDELRTAVVTDNEGVHVRKVDNDNVQLIQNEVLITQKDVNIVSGGVRNSTFGSGYVRLLDMIIRVGGGGLVIEAAED